MNIVEDPFETVAADESRSDFKVSSHKPVASIKRPTDALPGAVTARFHGFDLEDQPLISGLPGRPGEIVAARTTVPLSRGDAGCAVVVLFEQGSYLRPIVVGAFREASPPGNDASRSSQRVSIQADGECFVVSAEREIVLRCGDASITLTRAGKVIIKGNYIISRSTGYNKIKGAAVDIN